MVVPVRWIETVPRERAITFKGKYGNQNSATRLTDPVTRATVLERLLIPMRPARPTKSREFVSCPGHDESRDAAVITKAALLLNAMPRIDERHRE